MNWKKVLPNNTNNQSLSILIVCGLSAYILSAFLHPVEKKSATITGHVRQPFSSSIKRTDNLATIAAAVTNRENLESAPAIQAYAALVYDPLSDQYLFEKHTEDVVGIASITKLMTAFTAYDILTDNELILISKEAISTEGTAGNLRIGERVSVGDLVKLMLVESSNDAASAIAEEAGKRLGGVSHKDAEQLFIKEMNKKAISLGMTQTTFRNPTGLDMDENTHISNTSTAHDILRLALASYKIPYIAEYSSISAETFYAEDGTEHTLFNINTIAQSLPNFIGGKTGYTDRAGGSLVVTAEIPFGFPKVIIVLGSTQEGRFTDMEALIHWLSS